MVTVRIPELLLGGGRGGSKKYFIFFVSELKSIILRYLHVKWRPCVSLFLYRKFEREGHSLYVCLFGFNVALKHLRSLLVAVVLWPKCCHTEMPCRRHRTRHPTPSQYTDTGPTFRCAIHWYGTSHWNTQLLIFVLGETRPGNPSPTFHTHQRTLNLMLSWWSTVGSSVESTVPTKSWTRDLWCANPVRYPLAHSDFLHSL